MAKILITGGTGLVGSRLSEILLEKKHDVVILSRNPKGQNQFKWDVEKQYIDKKALENTDFIIHLAGAGIADKRWTDTRKKIIIDSRVDTADLLLQKVKEHQIELKGFISASGVGYYGAITSNKIFVETDDVAHDFLGEVCQKWEDAAHQFKTINSKVTILRTGVVLSKNGGALEKMKTPIVTPLGSGKQYMPWIHIEDLCQIYLKAIEDNLSGIFNAVAPEHVTNSIFSKTLAKSIKRPYLDLGVPSFILKMVFGDMANILLKGSRVSAKKIEKNGYSFRFNTLKKALNNL